MKNMLLCSLLLLGLVGSAKSETYYLLSKERLKAMSPPLPFNPYPADVKVHRVVDNIWLVEDEPGDAKGEMSVEDVGLRLALRIQIARESAAILAKANVVFPTPPPPPVEKPKFTFSGMGFNRDIVKEMKPNSGPTIRAYERFIPGFSTNFSKAQLADPVDFPKNTDPHWNIVPGADDTTNNHLLETKP